MFCKKFNNNFIRLNSRSFASDVKPFNSIPGPKSLPLIGTLWMYLPVFGKIISQESDFIEINHRYYINREFYLGKYDFYRLHRSGFLKLKDFGPLVREEIAPGIPLVWVFKPEDIETVYRCEGQYPQRRSHLILQKYRLSKPEFYNSGGLLPT